MIRIGQCQLAFVTDLSQAFPDPAGLRPRMPGDETVIGPLKLDDSSVLSADEQQPATITHRRGQTRFLKPHEEGEAASIPKVGRAAATLCRLAFELAKAPDAMALADWPRRPVRELEGRWGRRAGLAPRIIRVRSIRPNWRSLPAAPGPIYRTIACPAFWRTTVLREGEAVLARNVMGDSTLGSRDSKGDRAYDQRDLCADSRATSTSPG